ncbi:General transcription factor 3C polypeptide 4 [Trichoplax sp. H2]|nr:General transcription factor 3C polypeptide 4 [Trichoplax sp. H2]|eukprot:RDD38567.1 General transcription factor 3C polypeptide 4 [Trichoplax sp. H2]
MEEKDENLPIVQTITETRLGMYLKSRFCLAWSQDGKLALVCDKSIQVLSFMHQLHNVTSSLSYIKSTAALPKTWPTVDLGTVDYTGIHEHSYDVYSHDKFDPAFNSSDASVDHIKWSPDCCSQYQECILTVITSNYKILFYTPSPVLHGIWDMMFDMSSLIHEKLKACHYSFLSYLNGVNPETREEKYIINQITDAEYLGRCFKLSQIDAAWSPINFPSGENCSILASVNRNRELLIWKINIPFYSNNSIELVGFHSLNIESDPYRVQWIMAGDLKGYIAISFGDGQIQVYSVSFENKKSGAIVHSMGCLWQRDYIPVNEIIFHQLNKNTVRVAQCKGSSTVYSDLNCYQLEHSIREFQSNCIINSRLDSKAITGFAFTGVGSDFLACTTNRLLIFRNSSNSINDLPVNIKNISSNNQDFCGMALSGNYYFAAILSRDQKPRRESGWTYINTTLTVVQLKSINDAIQEYLLGSWDVYETIRIAVYKNKNIPETFLNDIKSISQTDSADELKSKWRLLLIIMRNSHRTFDLDLDEGAGPVNDDWEIILSRCETYIFYQHCSKYLTLWLDRYKDRNDINRNDRIGILVMTNYLQRSGIKVDNEVIKSISSKCKTATSQQVNHIDNDQFESVERCPMCSNDIQSHFLDEHFRCCITFQICDYNSCRRCQSCHCYAKEITEICNESWTNSILRQSKSCTLCGGRLECSRL